ncbi:FecR family protein [bacterium]|nr:FecR family protein [bacterium]
MLQLVLNKPTKLLVAVLLIAIGNVYAAEPIGGIIEQSGKAGSIVRLSGEELTANLQTDIISFDEVETENGRLKIQFVDETQVSLTEHTYMEIDEYVYDPDPSKSKMALNFVQGTARFATGGLGLVPKENIQIQTPTATIGIRGTDFTTTVDELGRSLVILLPDADCDDAVRLEEGCRPSGSITVTNDGGTVVLEEAFQAVMVSTFETPPTNPVIIMDLDLNMIDNMFIVSEPKEITVAKEEQIQELKGDGGLLDFDGLDKDFLESEDLGKAAERELEFTELDINFLDVDFLRDLLEIMEEKDALAGREEGGSGDKLVDRAFGLQSDNQFNIVPDVDGSVFFLRQGTNFVGIKIKRGQTGQLEIRDKDLGETVMCLNNCDGIIITITQQ